MEKKEIKKLSFVLHDMKFSSDPSECCQNLDIRKKARPFTCNMIVHIEICK